MKHGDISNQPAPVILIDVRLILEKRREGLKGLFKKKLFLLPGARNCLYYIFREGIEVWLVIPPNSGLSYQEVRDFLEGDAHIQYNELVELDSTGLNVDMYLRLDYFHGFYHTYEGVPTTQYAPKSKHKAISKINDIFYFLKG